MKAYFLTYWLLAFSLEQQTCLPASYVLAQGYLESGGGKSSVAINYRNHFGIMQAGKPRSYVTVQQGFLSHCMLIQTRYKKCINLPAKEYCACLKNTGYATDKKYAEKLSILINKFSTFKPPFSFLIVLK